MKHIIHETILLTLLALTLLLAFSALYIYLFENVIIIMEAV